MKKLIKIHKQVKNHPFRLNHSKNPKRFHKLMVQLQDEFKKQILKYFDGNGLYEGTWYFMHEMSSAIFNLSFYYVEKYKYSKKEYGTVTPQLIIILIESYIQQVHNFIKTKEFKEFTVCYLGCNKHKDGRWSKYKLCKNNKFKLEKRWK